jgi:hypothetical protein
MKTLIELLIGVIQILAEKRLAKNSNNSSVPPLMDPKRKRKPKEKSEDTRGR